MHDFINQHKICQNELEFNWENVEYYEQDGHT